MKETLEGCLTCLGIVFVVLTAIGVLMTFVGQR
jgi:hypothetical protein